MPRIAAPSAQGGSGGGWIGGSGFGRQAIAGKLKRAAASLKAQKPIAKPAKKTAKKKKLTKKKPATKAKPKHLKVVGRIAPKAKADTPSPAVPGVRVGPIDPGGIILAALGNAEDIVLSGQPFSLHDSKQAIGIVRDALETIAVVESHRPPAQVEAEMSQFTQVALDFVPQKRRADFIAAFEKALKAAT